MINCWFLRHVFIVADRAEIRKVEKELAAHKDSLEETVKRRTLELQEKESR